MRNSRVVNKDMNALVEQLLEPDLHELLVGHIADVGRGGAAGVHDPLAGGGRGGLVYIQNANHCALRRESKSDGLPNATAAAGDHCDFAVEPEVPRAWGMIGQSDTPRFQGMKSS
jgi:hypothetical protein